MEPVSATGAAAADAAGAVPEALRRAIKKGSVRAWLVTGVGGFIGSHLAETLLSAGERVIGVDNFLTGRRSNLDDLRKSVGPAWERFAFHEIDIRDTAAMTRLAAEADILLHQAALGSVPRSVEEPLMSNEMNVSGFLSVLTAAGKGGIRRVVYASSSAVYGDCADEVKTETRIGASISPYAASKRCDEVYADAFAKVYSQSIVGLRYFNVFGPRQDPNGQYAAVVPRWIQALVDGRSCQIFGDGETSRDFCFVRNVVQANILAAVSERAVEHEVYNVAVGKTTSLNELYRLIASAVAVEAKRPEAALREPEYLPFRKGDIRMSLADVSKAERELGYRATHGLSDGLLETVRWFVAAA